MLKRKPISNHFQQNRPFPSSRQKKRLKKYSKTFYQKSQIEKLIGLNNKKSRKLILKKINEEKSENIYVSDIRELKFPSNWLNMKFQKIIFIF